MGLGGVELVIEVEERFGISIPDADAEKIDTVGRLTDYVLAATTQRQSSICQTSRAFYKVRKALTEQFGIPRPQVQLETHLVDLLPLTNRRKQWACLSSSLEVRPQLVLSRLVCAIWIFTTILTFAAVLAISKSPFLLIILTPVIFALAYRASRPFADQFPKGMETVKELSLIACKLPKNGDGSFTRPDVVLMIRSIVSAQTGVPMEKLTRETHFIRDLKLN
jgi:hypothetical protein